jgi:hypothetical protein
VAIAAPVMSPAAERPADEEEPAPWPEGSTAVPVSRDIPPADSLAAPAAPGRPESSLPDLETLVKRIPPEVREALDDLFRVKFVNVQSLPASTLKQ